MKEMFRWRLRYTFNVICLSIFALVFYFFYSRQENVKTKLLEECSFFTVMHPDRIVRNYKMYYHYSYNGQRREGIAIVGAHNLGFLYSNEKVLSSRFWVQVHCNDFNPKRVRWEFVVPDTLWNVPEKGWDKIPYGINKDEK